MLKIVFNLIKVVLLLILYLVFIFYDELFRESVCKVRFNRRFLYSFSFVKKNIIYKFPVSINIYSIVSSFFSSLGNLNINFNISINLFSRPGVNLRLFFFYIIYNFVASYLICCITWAGSWHALTVNLRYFSFLPENYMYLNFKIAPFFMYLLITAEVLIILLILCFIWWQFEFTVLIPLNLSILLYYLYCFLFSCFWKFIIIFIYYLFNNFIFFILKVLSCPFRKICISFFNNLWPWIKYAIWKTSSVPVKICICIYIFITFNFIFFFIYLFLFNIIVFY